MHPIVPQDLLTRKLAPSQANRHTCPRLGAGANEIQLSDTRVLDLGSEGKDIEERVAESEDGAFVEVELFFPGCG